MMIKLEISDVNSEFSSENGLGAGDWGVDWWLELSRPHQ
jgi:hypothetical protein